MSEESIRALETGMGITELNKTSFIEFLLNQYNENLDPSRKLEIINDQKMLLEKEQLKLTEQTRELTQQMIIYNELKNEKQKKKPTALEAIKRKLLEEDYEMAEKISKTWSSMLGIPALALLKEANEIIKRTGI